MMLIPGVLALLFFGLLPIGGWLAEDLAQRFALPVPAVLGALFGAVVAGSTALTRLFAGLLPQEGAPHEDRPAELGIRRGQNFTVWLLLACIGAGILTVLIVPRETARVATLLASAALVALPGLSLVKSTWPPVLPVFVPPDVPEEPARPEPSEEPADEPEPDDPDLEERQYEWRYHDHLAPDSSPSATAHEITLGLRRSVYKSYRNRTRGSGSLAHFVRAGITDEVKTCARLVGAEATDRGLAPLDAVSFVLAFLRDAFPYGTDEETHGCCEYQNYPIETLWEQTCDCEDHAILGAALLKELGFDVGLIEVSVPNDIGHAAIGVRASVHVDGYYVEHGGVRYYYCEGTPAGDWRFGEVPPDYLKEGVELAFVPLAGSA